MLDFRADFKNKSNVFYRPAENYKGIDWVLGIYAISGLSNEIIILVAQGFAKLLEVKL